MRLFVGTLYSGENEFDECVSAIKNQTYKDYDHYIFRDLSLKDSHHTLYKAFLEKRDTYEVLAKVDADTVICRDNLFEKVVDKFTHNPWMEVYTIDVKDFYLGELIQAGMAFYRNTVKWNFDRETLFVDIPETSREHQIHDRTELAPAAWHGKNPLPYHAFHYGIYRGFKSIAKIHSTTHWHFLEIVWKNFLKTGDVRIGLPILAAELVYAGKIGIGEVDYGNEKVKALFTKYEGMDANAVKKEIEKLRALNWGFLPGDLRRKWLRRIKGGASGEKIS